ncbi:MAG: FkbM family methyltransferase, partial [Bacteroidota bacterium]
TFQAGDICLDIGANIGWYSLLLHKLMPASGTIYSFEPDPLNYQLLCENLQLNEATNVAPVNNALSNQREVMKLYRYENKNLGRHSLLAINSSDYVDIETLILDDYLAEQGIDFTKLNFAKIDIEGYEYFALQGAKKALAHIQCLVCEFEPDHILKGGLNPTDLIDFLTGEGFQAHLIKANKAVPVSTAELLTQAPCDIIWRK